MVNPAERHRKFITDLLCQSAGLRKTQVVRVAGLATADEAGLFRNEPQMLLVPQPFGFGEGEHAFVDAGADLVFCRGRVQFGWLVVALIRCRLDLGELAKRLHAKGIPDEVATEVLERFAEVGIVDDALFARMWVDSRHRTRGRVTIRDAAHCP